MSVKAQLTWFRHGAARTTASLSALETDLRALQEKVEGLTQIVARLDADAAQRSREQQRVEQLVGTMKDQLRRVTDDLGDRIGSIAARVDARA